MTASQAAALAMAAALLFAASLSEASAALPGPQAPCRDLLMALTPGQSDAGAYLNAAACLRKRDSLAAAAGEAGGHSPLERSLGRSAGAPFPGSDSLLNARSPGAREWYLDQMERARGSRDMAGILAAAYLTEAKGWADADISHALANLYLAVPDTYRAGLVLLRQGETDSLQAGYLQYQLENLTHYAGSEIPAAALVDSLTAAYRHRVPRSAELLETLSWSVRDYPAAYRNLMALMGLKKPDPGMVIERVNRFQSLGYFDYAASLLAKLDWPHLPQPWLALARTLNLQIRGQLQDWPAIVAEAEAPPVAGALRQRRFSDEETYLIGNAYLNLGRSEEALGRAKGLEEKAEAPWGFRGRLLKARSLMALGKSPEAGRVLDALKRDPKRKEATGPILFWQACLALDQARFPAADSLLVLASAYAGGEESQRALEYRFFLLVDTGQGRNPFFRGLPESPHGRPERKQALDKVPDNSALWPFAQLEKAQILLAEGAPDSAEAIFDKVSKSSPDRLAGFQAEAKAAFTAEKLPGGRQAALARYENLLIKYQQGVIPEFSRGRIKALR